MANVKKHISKSGKITYYIRAFDGYNSDGEQIVRSMTWKPSENLSEKQIEKELQRQAVLFEEKVKNGACFDSNTRFAEYAEMWLDNNKPPLLAPKTYSRYRALLNNINIAIGDIKLVKLQAHHLQQFYNNLREDGIKKVGAYAIGVQLTQYLKEKKITHNKLSSLSGVSVTTIRAACREDNHVSLESAEKIAKALNISINKLFKVKSETTGYSSKTILHHHRLISSILSQATRDRLVPFNVADKNYIKAPKLEPKEAVFLDDEQVERVLEALESEPIKWKTAMYLLIFSGMRRGELMGLEWKDIDFENKVIHVKRTSQYVEKIGIITKSPKNETSYRTIKLPDFMFEYLQNYYNYWKTLKKQLEDAWQDRIEIILADGTKKKVQNDRLFIKEDTTPMNPDSITDWTKKFIKRNNLPFFTPHSLRHTHATILIAEGASIPAVSRRLGHSSVATTSRIYVHAIQAADEIASDIIEGKFNPKNIKK